MWSERSLGSSDRCSHRNRKDGSSINALGKDSRYGPGMFLPKIGWHLVAVWSIKGGTGESL